MLRDHLLGGRRASTFTLQWHLTNACDLNCLHCYDRTALKVLDLAAAERVISDFASFCRKKRVLGQVCLTGGNPLLYPHVLELYASIDVAGFPISILGNPAPREKLMDIASIRKPVYYQLSLEGLQPHNDRIRGAGHFERVLQCLRDLGELKISSHVMLTATKDNLAQILSLAEQLEGLADRFTFNRLAEVGAGASLEGPECDDYQTFLRAYHDASRHKPMLRCKDNLFNILRKEASMPLLPGCTGHGCGAAFNFVALLPNGEVHACRKFPSPIGSIREHTLDELYQSKAARNYRRGPKACQRCSLRTSCGGCPAVTYGQGREPMRERDPNCFLNELESRNRSIPLN